MARYAVPLALVLSALAFGAFGATAGTPCRSAEPIPWRALGAGAWIWPATDTGERRVHPTGHVAATTVIVHGREALVIDPGPTHRHGVRLKRAVACRFQAQVRWIINTHAHAENVLANSAFADRAASGRTRILATETTRQMMAQRCANCLASMTRRLGEVALQGTTIVLPTETLRAGDVLHFGRWRLEVMEVRNAHSESDLMLWDRTRRILWTGGLVEAGRIPELAQGSLKGWLAVLEQVRGLRPRQLIAADGVVAHGAHAHRAIEDAEHYLLGLRDAVASAIEAGLGAHEIDSKVPQGRLLRPADAERHALNLQRAWRELEAAWFERGPSIEQIRR
ncbi:MAG: MBL fold metallo-hydrolase [Casimicrobiaceae bacterium]